VLPRIVWKIANKAVTSRDVTILHTPVGEPIIGQLPLNQEGMG
jgi:hypothetical protein